jgi:hypothetical protein
MADKQQIENSINYRFKDLGDGTFARVVAIDGELNVGSISVGEIEISNDSGNPIPVSGSVTIGNAQENPVPVQLENSAEAPLYVEIGSQPVAVIEGLSLPQYDHASITYTGDNATQAVYRQGGSGGTIVATVSMTYNEAGKLTSITKV